MTVSPGATPNIDLRLAARIVTAYVSHNSIPAADMPALIARVHDSIGRLAKTGAVCEKGRTLATPEQIEASIRPDGLISFEDGKSYHVLRRHLNLLGMTPETYRARWGLSVDYPMTSASYSAKRSKIAHSNKLGHKQTSAIALAA